MKVVSQTYKDNIKQIGREITYQITYTNNGTTTTLGDADILNANMHYEGGILKSVMKQLDIELYNDIPIGTELNYKFGVWTGISKNLFNKNDEPYRSSYYIGGGGVEAHNNEFAIYKVYLEPNTTYTMTNSGQSNGPAMCFYNSSNTFLSGEAYQNRSTITFTTPANTSYGLFSVVANSTSNRYDLQYFQIEKGNEATEYEEYSEYEKINYGNFIVYSSEKQEDSGTYKLVCYDKMLYAMKDYEALKGKNLYDASYRNVNNSIYCVNGTATESNGVFTLTATGTDLYMWQIRNSGTAYDKNFAGDIYAFDKDEYTISTTNQTIKANYVTFYDENKTSLGFIGFGGVGYTRTIKKGVNNVPSNAKYFSLRFGFNQAVVGQTYSFSVLVEEGNTATNYVPYLSYPITIRDYATILAYNIGLTFANANDDFTNYDKLIENDLFIDSEGNSIGYTYRDALDELAEATASTICINDNDELEIRYINNGNGDAIDFEILGNTTQNTTPSKNIISFENLSNTTNLDVQISYDKSEIQLNGTTNGSGNLIEYSSLGITIPAGTYTISYRFGSGTATRGAGQDIAFILRDTNDNNLANITLSQIITSNVKSTTFTTSASTTLKYTTYCNNSGIVLNNLVMQVQLESGSTATTYEPYTGAVPNPNFPREVENKTGNVEMTFASGKNLCDGLFRQGNTIDTTINNRLFTKNDIFGKSGKTYTISTNLNTDNFKYAINVSSTPHPSTNFYDSGWKATSSFTFTLNQDGYIGVIVSKNGNAVIPNDIKDYWWQIEEGNQPTTYEKYYSTDYTIDLGNLELCKIGTYQDRLFKASGKNLFDGELELGSLDQSSGNEITATNRVRSKNYNIVSGSTQYTLSSKTLIANKYIQTFVFEYDSNNTFIQRQSSSWTLLPFTFTTSATTKKIRILLSYSDGSTTNTSDFYNTMFNEGNTALPYEPYGNYWYKYNAIGKVVLDGSENWNNDSGTQGTNYRHNIYYASRMTIPTAIGSSNTYLSNYFIASNVGTDIGELGSFYMNKNWLVFVDKNKVYDLNAWKTWLETNKPIIYYALATPTYERITGDLERQLDNVRQLELIDAEYLKDINVNFGEIIEPINTITLKRSGDSDAISLSSPEDLADNQKHEIAISENQIMNFEDRDTYMQPILGRLYGLSYSINDFNSTGITWLDLCDRYNILITKTDEEGNTIESNVYTCVMFNDEINVNQGLQETIHTDRPEESITDYNTTTKSDRLQTRTDLIVNKQEGNIEAITTELGMVDGESQVIKGIKVQQNSDHLNIEAITSYQEIDGEQVLTGVKTGKGFTFNNSGLIITNINEENSYKTKIDETGTFYYDGETELGRTTNEGSAFKNMDLYGEFRYGKDNIDDPALFVSMKYEDDGEECFGHFWNGD